MPLEMRGRVVGVADLFFDEIGSIASPSQLLESRDRHKLNSLYLSFTMESLILAQDERWRRA